jgi:thioredoxin reductase
MMDRQRMLELLEIVPEWDIIIIGGGATGLGAAVDAASRGYKTLLAEQVDFAKGYFQPKHQTRAWRCPLPGTRQYQAGEASFKGKRPPAEKCTACLS